MIVLVQVRGEDLVFKCKGGPLGYCWGAEGEVYMNNVLQCGWEHEGDHPIKLTMSGI